MKYKTIEEIEALTLDDVIIEVILRLVDTSQVPIGTLFYEYSNNTELDPYYRIQLHESIEKPSLAEVESEFTIYKQELLDAFSPQQAAKTRLNALSDLRALVDRLDIPNRVNLETLKQKIIQENDIALIEALEAENAVYLPEKILQEEIEEDILLGKRAKDLCNNCLHIVRGHNSKANMSKTEVKAMKQTFADILDDLQDGMPKDAKAGIEATDNPAFDELKNKLLKYLEKQGV